MTEAYKTFEPLPSLKGLKVLISGGTTGIGRATAHGLIACGADVFIFGRHREHLRDAVAEAPATGGTLTGTVADQAAAADVKRVFEEAFDRLGKIDVLVNNAAITNDDVMDGDDAEIAYIVTSNLTGYILCTRHALRSMVPNKSGQIINVGSMSAEKRSAGGEVYTATKAAIRGFSDSLRRTYGEMGIRVCLIEPGKTGSDLIDDSPEEQRDKESAMEMLTAEEVARCIIFCVAQPTRVSIARLQVVPVKHQS
jgi:NADP-dependent 3-hydroxy acid dehydrogenase YdfG